MLSLKISLFSLAVCVCVWETNPSRFLVRYLYPQVVRLCLCALLRSRRRPSTRARERDVLLLHHPPKVLSIRGFRQQRMRDVMPRITLERARHKRSQGKKPSIFFLLCPPILESQSSEVNFYCNHNIMKTSSLGIFYEG